jgi:hypothetical protein
VHRAHSAEQGEIRLWIGRFCVWYCVDAAHLALAFGVGVVSCEFAAVPIDVIGAHALSSYWLWFQQRLLWAWRLSQAFHSVNVVKPANGLQWQCVG